MARKNKRMRSQYSCRRLSNDLFKLTKRKAYGVISLSNITEKENHMETPIHVAAQPIHASATTAKASVSSATSVPRPAKPQGMDDPRITRGSVWFADLAPRTTSNLITSVQSGTRPVLVISNNLNNRLGTVITIIPFTGAPKRLDMSTHVAVDPADVRNGYQPSEIYASTLLCEQVTALDKARLVSYVGSVVSPSLMSRVESALLTQVGIKQQSHKPNESSYEKSSLP